MIAALLTSLPACSSDLQPGATSSGSGGASAGSGTGGSVVSSTSGGGAGGMPVAAIPGLRAEYFANYLDLALEQIEPDVDHDWGDAAPGPGVGADAFSARWTGLLVPPASGMYTLTTETDDGVRLWIDDQLVIDDWHGHFVTQTHATIALQAGVPVPIRLEYFELDLAASARLSWSSATLAQEIIPTSQLIAAPTSSGLPGPTPPYQNPVIAFDCPDPGVIASGTSTRHASALAEHLSREVKRDFGVWPEHLEGIGEGRWVLLDYGALIVHVFYDFVRQEYRLEELWTKKLRK